LEAVPLALAENSGLPSIESLTAVKARQLAENNPHLGIDCNDTGTNDMREQNVFETLIGKKQQLFLATQVRQLLVEAGQCVHTPGLRITPPRVGLWLGTYCACNDLA
jgi:T-complex protein 1 subunit epsilon